MVCKNCKGVYGPGAAARPPFCGRACKYLYYRRGYEQDIPAAEIERRFTAAKEAIRQRRLREAR